MTYLFLIIFYRVYFTDIAANLGKNFLDKKINRFNKKHITRFGITLINNEIKDFIKEIKT